MSILIDEKTRVIVQGFTGDKATFHAKEMIAYGTNVVGGVTPGKGGTTHLDRPVFNTVKEAVAGDRRRRPASSSCRPPFCADAIMEAADAGIRLVCRHHRRHPGAGHDDGEALPAALSRRSGAPRWSGPTAPASSAPGKAMLGIMPGHIYTRGQRRRGDPLGHARLRGGGADEGARHRADHERGHRRRSDQRQLVPRHPGAVRGRTPRPKRS